VSRRVDVEALAATVRVVRMLAAIPRAQSPGGDLRAAKVLAGWGQPERDRFAKAHGCAAPSEAMWSSLVLDVAHRTADAALARLAGTSVTPVTEVQAAAR
jgi:hypothetical protein